MITLFYQMKIRVVKSGLNIYNYNQGLKWKEQIKELEKYYKALQNPIIHLVNGDYDILSSQKVNAIKDFLKI
ncbi:MAG: hypothetical protein IPF43_05740 [Arcobacter sp.]|nr:hypothetical protein [Arcobacter sp.]